MSPRYAALSVVAFFVICLLILKNYETWTRPIETAPERASAKKQEAKTENPLALRPQNIQGPAQSNAIAGKNIFSPERKDFPVQSLEARPIVRPQVVLYGVTIGGGYQFASIVNPGRRLLRGERETLSVKVGDKVGDYKLTRISSDRITLEAEGGDVFEVFLYDPKAPKKRMDVRTETKAATITSSQASPQAGVASSTGSTPTPLPTPSVTPKPSAPTQQAGSPPVVTPSTPLPAYDYRRSRRPFAIPPSATPPAGPSTGATPPAPGQPQDTGGN